MINYGFEFEKRGQSPALIEQTHGNTAVLAWHENPPPNPLPIADAIYISKPDYPIYIFTADCLPVLMHGSSPDDPIAAIHCGWRGALAQIVTKTRDAIKIPPERLRAILGPCIRACCFEVKSDFIEAFQTRGYSINRYLDRRNLKDYFDLSRWVIDTQLANISPTGITQDGRCTVCHADRMPSFRRDKTTDPRIRAWICKTSPTP